jgi:hypothetical protein
MISETLGKAIIIAAIVFVAVVALINLADPSESSERPHQDTLAPQPPWL